MKIEVNPTLMEFNFWMKDNSTESHYQILSEYMYKYLKDGVIKEVEDYMLMNKPMVDDEQLADITNTILKHRKLSKEFENYPSKYIE